MLNCSERMNYMALTLIGAKDRRLRVNYDSINHLNCFCSLSLETNESFLHWTPFHKPLD